MSYSSTSNALNILCIGGSRNIGYYSSVSLLEAGAKVTFLLRNPSVFDSDATIQKFVKDGRAFLVKGDALVLRDVKKAWDSAGQHGKIHYLLSTVGGVPSFSLTQGFVIDPPNLVTQSFLNTLRTMLRSDHHTPRIVVLSSLGLMKTGHKSLPIALKPVYNLLKVPHGDKLGVERIVSHCAGWRWDSTEAAEPGLDIMGPGEWKKLEGLPEPGSLTNNFVVVRPAWLTDSDKSKPYRASEEELGGYTISRKDTARFVVDVILNDWDQYVNKRVNVGY